jgi:hypothetical protein
VTELQEQIFDELASIPDRPYWVAWAQVAEALGRPSTHGRAVAQAAQPLQFNRWEQVRNVEGVYVDDGTWAPAFIERLRQRGVPVDDRGRAFQSCRLWPDGAGGWVAGR